MCTFVHMGVRKIKEKILKNPLYSLDKIRVELGMRRESAQYFMGKLGCRVDVNQWLSNKLSVCHYNYTINLEDDNSFYIGFEPNWMKSVPRDVVYCIVEFNPAKVDTGTDYNPFIEYKGLAFYSLYGELLKLSTYSRKVLKFDLAIDLPIAREKVQLVKDKRLYEEISTSMSDKTQYLGRRNTHGRIKLYNKALEQKLNIDLTRLEITIDFNNRSIGEVQRLVPQLYVLDNFQFSVDMTGTDVVLMTAVLGDLSLLKLIERRKKAKILQYLSTCEYNFKVDVDCYNKILKQIDEYVK